MKTSRETRKERVVIANWKMNPISGREAERLATQIARITPKPLVQIVIAPPAVHLTSVRAALPKAYALGAQDVHEQEKGPHTGSISASMLFGLGARFSIVGHSERRAKGETDSDVNNKVRSLLLLGMTPVICVGEKERDTHGKYYSFVEAEIKQALAGVKRTDIEKTIIAYEPIWAISKGDGKGATATAEHAHEMKLFIQKVLVELYGRPAAMRVRIVYGGSVNSANASDLVKNGEVDGFLVGGASLVPKDFAAIVKAVEA